MDAFGIGALIQKVEDYFGKWVCGAMLFLLCATAVILCIHAIVAFGVIPIVETMRGINPQSFIEIIGRIGFGLIIGGVGSLPALFLAQWYFNRWCDKVIARSSAHIEELKALQAQIDADSDRVERAREEAMLLLAEITAAANSGDDADPSFTKSA